MISDTGKDLNIVIRTQTSEDWEAFATWYSIWKNLPDAKLMLLCTRNDKVEFQYFQWAKRLKIPITYIDPTSKDERLECLHQLQYAKQSFNNTNKTLMLSSYMMVLDTLDEETLRVFNREDYDLLLNPGVVLSSIGDLQSIIEDYHLLGEMKCRIVEDTVCRIVQENDPYCIVDYSKGCGKWIHTLKGCPFSNASGLVADSMTANEIRIIELWRKMVSLYSAIN